MFQRQVDHLDRCPPVPRLLKREYKSETDLTQVDRYEIDAETLERDEDARIFRREPRLVRTLSDTLLTRKQHTVDRSSKWNRFNFDEDFLRIDSNYNDAIEEVSFQRNSSGLTDPTDHSLFSRR